ncbi:uncharacterized protein C3F10.06c isoform X2 [Asparagus officinalis]|uniref:uncharacterized protein C3F10.06c isoform X2 n=1 Tax=Asparagus officinalis TaxID=4686 RepID=UPI00098DF4F4|nr:uncharacterized protein C3F10.06c isoform X2 [Asparagus officinalis]
MDSDERMSIYKATRCIKKKQNSIYNALRSIYEDSVFVSEIAGLWPDLPLVANLRCGLWYSSQFESTCYFKSTDGHSNNCSFSTARLNLHLAQLAGQRGGCIVVDSTRKGKRFPDSMSKTIPIWACVLNRAIARRLKRRFQDDGELELKSFSSEIAENGEISISWDCSLHLPLWVLGTEKAAIENRLEEWTNQLEACGADIDFVISSLRKPLRPLWISQRSLIWLNEVPDYDSWDFTPIILVSASATNGIIQQRTTSEFSWHYIPGAGDDEESWARGLSPQLFWKHAFDIIDSGPDMFNQKVSEIVEKERVYRSQRGEVLPQVIAKHHKSRESASITDKQSDISCQLVNSEQQCSSINIKSSENECYLSWIGPTSVALCRTCHVEDVSHGVDCLLNCDSKSVSFCSKSDSSYLHLPIVTSKLDRFSLMNNLSSAIDFAKQNLSKQRKLLICCHDGEDISVCVCLAIITMLFDEKGH